MTCRSGPSSSTRGAGGQRILAKRTGAAVIFAWTGVVVYCTRTSAVKRGLEPMTRAEDLRNTGDADLERPFNQPRRGPMTLYQTFSHMLEHPRTHADEVLAAAQGT